MAPIDNRPRLGDHSLLAGYDDRSIQRGLSYVAEGRTVVLDVADGTATGEVQGHDIHPYLVQVFWKAGVDGVRVVDDHCSCPLGGRCKHAVALLIAVARDRSEEDGDDYRRERSAAARRRLSVAWRNALDGIAVVEGPDGGDVTPLALCFSLHTPPATRYLPHPQTQLQVLPMRLGARGKWVRSGASWHDISSSYHHDLRNADPDQIARLRALLACVYGPTYNLGNSPLTLDRLGPAMWNALRHVVESGVELTTSWSDGTARLADDTARLAVDLRRRPDADVELHTTVTLDDRPLVAEAGRAGTIGSPAHGWFTVDDDELVLIPLERPAHAQLARLLAAPPLLIPDRDVDELIDEYQPQLAQHAVVGSSDGTVSIASNVLEGLVVHVEHPTVDTASLRWGIRYRRGDRVTTHLLHGPVGPGRDRVAERPLLDELELPVELLDQLRDRSGRPADLTVGGVDTVVLLAQVVPWLRERGQVIVETSGDAPDLREATEDPRIVLRVSDGAPSDGDDDGDTGRSDWFDLSVDVTIDGEHVEFVRLFRALSLDEPVLVLDSGTWLRLDRPELDRLRELITESRGLAEPGPSSTARISRFQTSWWDELAALGVVEQQSQRWERSAASLRQLSAPEPVAPPARLAATLRPYQQEGLDWLAFLHRNQLGGILADDMGLGKTVQTLAMFLHVLERRPDARFLVVAPTSVVANWQREANQFAPGVPVTTIRETASRRGAKLQDTIGDAQIVVTSYALFRLEFDQYQELDWEVLVLDEAQFVKNHRGKTYQCVRRLDVAVKLAVTGTPIENSLMDLWSLLSIAAPGLYPDPARFSEVYRKPIESGRAPELLATLRRRVAPLMRRRTKGEVLTELPPKIEQTIDIELGPRHRRIYEAQLQRQRQKVLGLVGDVDKHRFEILRSLTILRQLSLDPGLVDASHDDVGSAKIDRLVEDLEQVIAEGHRALVFSQFTSYLARVRSQLDAAGIDHAYLDGRTRDRDAAISSFKDGDAPVFVISLKAGGVGLNLTEADYCFVLDPWWNPAAETQAVDRAHRIGQRNAVMVYRYVSTDTIEEKVMDLKARKSALFASVMDADGALSGALDAEDIRALLE